MLLVLRSVDIMKRILLIDGDVFVYKIGNALEQHIDWGEGQHTIHADEAEGREAMDAMIHSLKMELEGDHLIIALTCHNTPNFRLALYPEYKQNRKNVRKPMLWKPLRDHLFSKWGAVIKDNLEADDVLGILATKAGPLAKGLPAVVDRVRVSIDKDFKSVPGKLYNPMHPEDGIVEITQHEADFQHMMQTLTGDSTDNYKGCPGTGPKKAKAILDKVIEDWCVGKGPDSYWPAIVRAFAKAGISEEDALVQARLARILRAEDYDFKAKQPILWRPQ